MRLNGPVAKRVIALLALLGMLLTVAATVATVANGQVPDLPLPLPTDEPEPQPEPRPEPTTTEEPTNEPAPEPQPTWAGPEGGPAPFFPGASDVPDGTMPPVPGPSSAPAEDAVRQPARLVGLHPVAAALPGAFGVSLAGLLAVTGLGSGILVMAKRGHFSVRADDGSMNVEATKRWRLLGGLALLAAAAAVGVIGWLKISLEPLVAVQMVYVASTGFAVLVLAIAGGSLVIAEQLRADERRLRDLEDAVVTLATQVRPLVSEPARLIERPATQPFDPDITTEIG